MAAALELAAGTRVAGRYTIVRELGRGGSKRVYLARDALTGIDVAVALLDPEVTLHAISAARFSREARTASALRSPFIVRVYDVGKLADDTRYLVLEAVLGRGLDEVVREGRVEPATAARWCLELLAALSEAHACGVIHRDVKPENVMLARTTAGEIAKLTDFGLAKVVDARLDGSIHLQTAANVIVGTPEYMPPEQWRGQRVDPRTDVYAVGVVLFEMLTGRAPFEGDSPLVVCTKHLLEEPPSFDRGLPEGALALEPVVRRALAKDPELRFGSALEMAQAISGLSGVQVPQEAFVEAAPRWDARTVRAELSSEVFDGPVTVLAAAAVTIGRDPSAHVRVRCVGSVFAEEVERTVSRAHASIAWRGGVAFVTDRGSSAGTFIDGKRVGREPMELRDRAILALGEHVWLSFSQAPTSRGELPRWARLSRMDRMGASHVSLLLLGGAAEVSREPTAALRWTLDARASLEHRDGALLWRFPEGERVLEDGQEVSLGDGRKLSVVLDR
jgi:hypothetical protein